MDILRLIGFALLPASGMLCGALAAHWTRLPHRSMGAVLHGAAGVAIAVVSVELMPRILEQIAPWQLVAGFLSGAIASVAMVKGVNLAVGRFELGGRASWRVYLPVAVDLSGDGLMIGIGYAVAGELGLMLGLSQVIANIPGGFAATADLRDRGVKKRVRNVAVGLLALPVFLGAGVGYWVLSGEPTDVQNTALAFVVGMLLLATVEDLVPEADEPQARRVVTTTAFAAGFVFFALLSLYMA